MSKEVAPAVSYLVDPDRAVQLARNEYVFYGVDQKELREKYKIPGELLAELVFQGPDSWAGLRAKVEEDELDRLMNSNLFMFKNSINQIMLKVSDFLTGMEEEFQTLSDAEKALKMVSTITKAAESLRKMQDHRSLVNMGKDARKGRVIPLLSNDEEEEATKFKDVYSAMSKEDEADAELDNKLLELLE